MMHILKDIKTNSIFVFDNLDKAIDFQESYHQPNLLKECDEIITSVVDIVAESYQDNLNGGELVIIIKK